MTTLTVVVDIETTEDILPVDIANHIAAAAEIELKKAGIDFKSITALEKSVLDSEKDKVIADLTKEVAELNGRLAAMS